MSRDVKKVDALDAEENLLIDFQLLLHRELLEKGWTRADLAKASGISAARLSQIFSADANPTLKTCARLFHALEEALDMRILKPAPQTASDPALWHLDLETALQPRSRRAAGERALLVAAGKDAIAASNDNAQPQVEHWGEMELADCA